MQRLSRCTNAGLKMQHLNNGNKQEHTLKK